MRQSLATSYAVNDPRHLLDLFFTPKWKLDKRTSEEIIADTLAAWDGVSHGNRH